MSKKVTKKSKDKHVIVRAGGMGVFAGILDDSSTETVKVVRNARRLWRWYGAASLSQLSVEGTSKPADCKFPCEVERVELTSPTYGFEVLLLTEKARASIASVAVWKA